MQRPHRRVVPPSPLPRLDVEKQAIFLRRYGLSPQVHDNRIPAKPGLYWKPEGWGVGGGGRRRRRERERERRERERGEREYGEEGGGGITSRLECAGKSKCEL